MKRERDSEQEAHCLALLLFTVSLIRARNTFIIQNKTSYLQFIKKKTKKTTAPRENPGNPERLHPISIRRRRREMTSLWKWVENIYLDE